MQVSESLSDIALWTRERVELFVRISYRCLADWRGCSGDHAHDGLLVQVMDAMERVVRVSIALRWENWPSTSMQNTWMWGLYGVFIQGRIVDDRRLFVTVEDSNLTKELPMTHLFPHTLIRALDDCRRCGLLHDSNWKLDSLVERSRWLSGTATEDSRIEAPADPRAESNSQAGNTMSAQLTTSDVDTTQSAPRSVVTSLSSSLPHSNFPPTQYANTTFPMMARPPSVAGNNISTPHPIAGLAGDQDDIELRELASTSDNSPQRRNMREALGVVHAAPAI